MTTLRGVSQSVYRTIVIGISFYFALLLVGFLADLPIALELADVVYGVLAVSVGVLLYTRAASAGRLVIGSAVCLVLGGLAQFLWLATRTPTFDALASTLVLFGLGGYLVSISIDN